MITPRQDWSPFVLLLIDAQRSFWPEERAKLFPNFPEAIARLLAFCRAEGIEVVHVRASFQPDMSDWMPKFRLKKVTPCVEGTSGVETLPFAVEQPHETVIFKHALDGFQNPELMAYLRLKQTRFVLTAGLVTSTCVLFTTASATQHGFLAAVVEDCCADKPAAHTWTLEHYGFVFDRTTIARLPMDHPGWLAQVEQLAGGPEPPT